MIDTKAAAGTTVFACIAKEALVAILDGAAALSASLDWFLLFGAFSLLDVFEILGALVLLGAFELFVGYLVEGYMVTKSNSLPLPALGIFTFETFLA